MTNIFLWNTWGNWALIKLKTARSNLDKRLSRLSRTCQIFFGLLKVWNRVFISIILFRALFILCFALWFFFEVWSIYHLRIYIVWNSSNEACSHSCPLTKLHETGSFFTMTKHICSKLVESIFIFTNEWQRFLANFS